MDANKLSLVRSLIIKIEVSKKMFFFPLVIVQLTIPLTTFLQKSLVFFQICFWYAFNIWMRTNYHWFRSLIIKIEGWKKNVFFSLVIVQLTIPLTTFLQKSLVFFQICFWYAFNIWMRTNYHWFRSLIIKIEVSKKKCFFFLSNCSADNYLDHFPTEIFGFLSNLFLICF